MQLRQFYLFEVSDGITLGNTTELRTSFSTDGTREAVSMGASIALPCGTNLV